MKRLGLAVDLRKLGKGESRRIRKEGMIPGIVYGKGIENIPIKVSQKKFYDLITKGGRNALIDLTVNGVTYPVLIKEVQNHYLKNDLIMHVDFQKISLNEEITADVPVRVIGEGIIETKGWVISYQLRELEVECLPDRLPEFIEIDVTNLVVGDSIKVKDLKLSEGVKVTEDPEDVILSIIEPEIEETTEETEKGEEQNTV